MRREGHTPRSALLPRAFWWTLAAVHVVPVARIAPAVPEDPSGHAATLGLLLAVVAFCVAAGALAARTGRTGRPGSTIVFLLAAAVAHHDAVGTLPPAEVPGPAVPVLLGAAASVGAVPWMRRLRRALRRLGDRLAASFGRPAAPALVVLARLARVPAPGVARRRHGPTVRGPPAVASAPAIAIAIT